MELSRYAAALRRWWWLILLSTSLAGFASYWAGTQAPAMYRTTTTVVVGQFMYSDNPQAGDFSVSQQLAQYYAQAVRRQSVLQGVIDTLDLDVSWWALSSQVNGLAPAGTNTIQISVVDGNPLQAKKIADEVARQLIRQSPTPTQNDVDQRRKFVQDQMASLQVQIQKTQAQIDDLSQKLVGLTSALDIQDTQGAIDGLQSKINNWQNMYNGLLNWYQGSRTNFLAVAEPAFVPVVPVSPTNPLNILVAAAAALLLAVGAAIVLDSLDDRLRSQEDVDQLSALPLLSAVGGMGKLTAPADALVGLSRPNSPMAEQYRHLRTGVQLAMESGRRALLVTSSVPKEGRSVIAANLAVSFGLAGHRTILVDADLHHPSLHTLFEIPNGDGLVSMLLANPASAGRDGGKGSTSKDEADEATGIAALLDARLASTGIPHLRVLPAGLLRNSVGDLLASSKMDRLLESLESMADVVILDSPPVLGSADAVVLASKGLGVVLVVDAARTRGKDARLARRLLAQARMLGVVLNRAPRSLTAFRWTNRGKPDVAKPVKTEKKVRPGVVAARSEAVEG